MSNDESQRQILPSEAYSDEQQQHQKEEETGNEEFKEVPESLPEQPPAIFDNAEF